jgi:hypothetical protein
MGRFLLRLKLKGNTTWSTTRLAADYSSSGEAKNGELYPERVAVPVFGGRLFLETGVSKKMGFSSALSKGPRFFSQATNPAVSSSLHRPVGGTQLA